VGREELPAEELLPTEPIAQAQHFEHRGEGHEGKGVNEHEMHVRATALGVHTK